MARKRDKPDGAVGVSPTGHNLLFGQPHTDAEGPIADAESAAAALISADSPMGKPGKPFDRKSPFFIAVFATVGVALTYGAIQLLVTASQVLVLSALALFLAIGLEPAVSWLIRHGFKRGLAVLTVLLSVVAVDRRVRRHRHAGARRPGAEPDRRPAETRRAGQRQQHLDRQARRPDATCRTTSRTC